MLKIQTKTVVHVYCDLTFMRDYPYFIWHFVQDEFVGNNFFLNERNISIKQ